MLRRSLAAPVAALTLFATTASVLPAQAAPEARDRVISRRVDIDGDGRKDRLTVTYKQFGRGLTVTVTPARGRAMTTRLATDLEQLGDPWVRTATVDGVRGSDIVVTEAFGDLPHHAVLTWRRGRLVRLDPPGGRRGETWTINQNYEGQPGYWGYSFGRSKGVRTVTTWQLSRTKSGRYFGPKVTYRWTPQGWRQASSTKVSIKQSEAARVTNFGGLVLS